VDRANAVGGEDLVTIGIASNFLWQARAVNLNRNLSARAPEIRYPTEHYCAPPKSHSGHLSLTEEPPQSGFCGAWLPA
jgi:hypothetical protein